MLTRMHTAARTVLRALLVTALVLSMAACSPGTSSDVIGFYFVTDTETQSAIRVHHFESKRAADDYYLEQQISKYYVFATEKGSAQEVFESMSQVVDQDGSRYVLLTGFDGTEDPADSVQAFLTKYGLVPVAS